MKIIVAGGGKVGRSVLNRLVRENHEIVLIDENKEILDISSEQSDVMTICGNAASLPVLKASGAEQADMLIAVSGSDEINLLSCLTAKSINSRLKTIARLRNPDYEEQKISMREQLGLSYSVNPEQEAALQIVRLLRYPGFIKIDTFAHGRADIVELFIEENNPLNGVPLLKLQETCRTQVLVCAILRGERAIIPSGKDTLQAGDRVFFTASGHALSDLMKNLGIIPRKTKKVMVIGGGRFGTKLSALLIKNGIEVKIIERDPEVSERAAEALPKAAVVYGEGGNQALLDSEGIGQTDALVALTGVDEINLIISMYAKKKGVPKVITRIEHMENAGMFDSMGAGSIISPKEICGSSVVRFVRSCSHTNGSMMTLHRIAGNQVDAMEFVVTEDVKNVGKQLKDISVKPNHLIACILSGHTVEIANGRSSFKIGDRVIVVASSDSHVKNLNDVFYD